MEAPTGARHRFKAPNGVKRYKQTGAKSHSPESTKCLALGLTCACEGSTAGVSRKVLAFFTSPPSSAPQKPRVSNLFFTTSQDVERGEGSNMVRTGALCAKLSNANRIHQMRPPPPVSAKDQKKPTAIDKANERPENV